MQSISFNILTPKFIPNIIIYKNIYWNMIGTVEIFAFMKNFTALHCTYSEHLLCIFRSFLFVENKYKIFILSTNSLRLHLGATIDLNLK